MKKALKYIITAGIGLIFFIFIILSKDITNQENAKDVFHILSDAAFVPGILILGFGLLVVASNGGTFDMLAYGVIRFFDLFKSDVTKTKHRTFYDYRMAKSENKSEFWYLVLVGLFYIGLAAIFLIFYN